MEKIGFIYGLFDTEYPDRIRYVGQTQTQRGLADRVYHHKWASRFSGQLPVYRWIREIGEDRVGYVEISRVPVSDLSKEEVYWIAEKRSKGHADLNVLDGGTGFSSGHVEGEKNPKARVNWTVVNSLRSRCQIEYVSPLQESQKWGITPAAVSKILLNRSWHDPNYDASKRITVTQNNVSGTEDPIWRRFNDQSIESIRACYLAGATITELADRWQTGTTSIRRVLFDKYASNESREKCRAKLGPRKSAVRLTDQQRRDIIKLRGSGLSQAEVAKRVGTSQTTVGNEWRKIN